MMINFSKGDSPLDLENICFLEASLPKTNGAII